MNKLWFYIPNWTKWLICGFFWIGSFGILIEALLTGKTHTRRHGIISAAEHPDIFVLHLIPFALIILSGPLYIWYRFFRRKSSSSWKNLTGQRPPLERPENVSTLSGDDQS
ncbi:MAG: hypothetical protein LKF30_00910 [Sphingobium sp.]|jgi:hypothetical protein|nr:hypothetical protein [Sphingobium sp.]MCI1271798.1 hypothetical protein [Sphingobium sp.]MCI1756163.1 hypothetical protein [Sphingobium sp.]MCI2054161.1 hypothetical protein [Sphingobium sp.]